MHLLGSVLLVCSVLPDLGLVAHRCSAWKNQSIDVDLANVSQWLQMPDCPQIGPAQMFVLPGYDAFLGFLLIAGAVPVLALVTNKLLSPRSQVGERELTYESGMEPIGGAWIQFNIRYYMFALVFVIFDVETVFLYPWAVAFHRLGLLAFIEALVFIAILVVALAYAWRKGALEWS